MRHSIRHLTVLLSTISGLAACGGGSSSPQPSDAGKTGSSQWVGKTFLLDTPAIGESNWTEPSGFGSDIGSYVPQFLIGVEAGSGDALTITLATATAGVQDPCNVTTPVTSSGAEYPNSLIQATAVPVIIMNTKTLAKVPATVHNFTLKNVLPGASAATNGELDATVDVADLYSLFYAFGANPTKDSVCSPTDSTKGLPAFGVNCETCPQQNGGSYCLTLQAVQIGATLAPSPVKTVLASDIDPTSCQ